jgi:hypothetical protein
VPSEAVSDVKIAQRACSRAGINPITSFSDGTAEAVVLNDSYEGIVSDALASFPWPFATRQEALNRLTDDPPVGWRGLYQMPATCLHLRAVYLNDRRTTKWAYLQGRVAVDATENDAVTAEFTERVAEAAFHPVFTEYVVTRLAAILAAGVAHDGERAKYFEQQAYLYYKRARFINASERTPRRLVANRLTGYR